MASVALQRTSQYSARTHLSTVPSPQQAPLARAAKAGSLKRTRSTEQSHERGPLKRQKAIAPSPARRAVPAERERVEDEREMKNEARKTEKEQYKENFKEKYTKAFPKFSFYIHTDVTEEDADATQALLARIDYLHGHVEEFFSKDGVTHFITNQLPEDNVVHSNKENRSQSRSRNPALLRSPINIRGAQDEAVQPVNVSLVAKAHAWNIKIWSVAKLESVLDRCDVPAFTADRRAQRNAPAVGGRSLMSLVEHERIYGTTERDGSAKHPDMHFFAKDSCFVLIEDMTSQLATIHAAEYPCRWMPDGEIKGGSWPKLHAHPEVRNPFTEPNEREFRRWRRDLEQDRQKKDEHEREQLHTLERERRRAAEAERIQQAQQAGDLRRSVSMVNLRKRALSNASERLPGESMFDAPEALESVNASGYLRSQYAAASGNSVTITSTTGTTSAGNSLTRNGTLAASFRGKEVTTSMKAAGRTKSAMGPPPEVPQKMLRKSKSTTTMRLPKREEGAKPGYCENCRKKYDDFETHISSARHVKFATDDSHFEALDMVLARISRPMKPEYVAQHQTTQVEEEPMYDGYETPNTTRVDYSLRSSSQPISDYLPQPYHPVLGGTGDPGYRDRDGADVQIRT